mmetsp:Transcript_9093/g.12928  ORF Transcript_9093/g.12928 Transcript_9093/m.12928 type:complete len:81 (-) Transcript_9093:2716-2958(-)
MSHNNYYPNYQHGAQNNGSGIGAIVRDPFFVSRWMTRSGHALFRIFRITLRIFLLCHYVESYVPQPNVMCRNELNSEGGK